MLCGGSTRGLCLSVIFLCVLLFESSLLHSAPKMDSSILLAKRVDSLAVDDSISGNDLLTDYFDFTDEGNIEYFESLAEGGGIEILEINTCSHAQLSNHPLIYPREAQAIFDYREKYGPFSSLHELQYIDGISENRGRLLQRLFTLRTSVNSIIKYGFLNQSLEITQRTTYRIPVGPRYEPKYRSDSTRPLGDPLGIQLRLLYQAKDWMKVGIKASKSPYEPFFSHFNRQGFSLYSGYILFDLPRVRLDRIILGSYNYRVGHGLLMQSQGFSFLTYDPYQLGRFAVLPQAAFCYPGSSALKGMALSMKLLDNLRLSMAFSFKMPNSRLVNDSIETLSITPILTSLSQAKHRYSTWEILGVTDLQYSAGNLVLGLGVRTLHYKHPFRLSSRVRKNPKPFYLQHSQGISTYFAWYGNVVQCYGEVLSQINPLARAPFTLERCSGLLGMNVHMPAGFALVLQMYTFGRYNNSIYQEHFALGSNPTNRFGGKMLVQYSPMYGYNAYAQLLYWNYFPTQKDASPHFGSLDFRAGCDLRPESGSYRAVIQYRLKGGQQGGHAAIEEKHSSPRLIHQLRTQFKYRCSDYTTLQVAALGVYNPGDKAYSWAFYPEVACSIPQWHLQLKCRAGYHQQVGKYSALRLYESSARYAFSMASLSKSGCRAYILAHYRPIRELMLTLKMGKTFYTKASIEQFTVAERASRRGIDCLLQCSWAPMIVSKKK